jgi:aspartate racemase
MKQQLIGLIGGMSWESSLEYYRIINNAVKARLGGHHNAKTLMYTVDFAEIRGYQSSGDWDKAADVLTEAALTLQNAGASFVVICTNTMHKVVPQLEAKVSIPILHIADATAEKIVAAGIQKVGLLATAFTMEEDFYKDRLRERFGLEVIVPNASDRALIHNVIFDELCLGVQNPASKAEYIRIMHDLVATGAEGIIYGCTEIMLLVDLADSPVPAFDTTSLHALAAVERALL